MKYKKLSVLVAAYNEQDTVEPCLERILSVDLPAGMDREIIVVDDASTDDTLPLLQELAADHPEIVLLRQDRNQGKGAALRRAITAMTGDLAIFQDADMEYDPADYGRMLNPILDGRAEVVFGSRFAGEERKVLYFWHQAGNKLLTFLSNLLNDTNLTDMETCYKAFDAECLRAMPLESNRFGIEPEVTAKVARNKFRLYEVPINYNGRAYEEGKKITWRDGFAALWFIFKYRFSSNFADPGKVALDALEQAPRFNRWMYSAIQPHLGERIVEIGCGRGNLTRLLRQGKTVLASDMREGYLDELRERWGHLKRVKFTSLDLTQRDQYGDLRQFQPDTIVCLNVLEHIDDDRAVLRNLYEEIPTGCKMVFLVPFNPALYSEFDRAIGHFRRYEDGELDRKMREAGFKVVTQFFFNKAGVLAWWVGNKLTKQRTITRFQLKVYNALTPLFRWLDTWLPMTGLSTVVVAQKEGGPNPSPVAAEPEAEVVAETPEPEPEAEPVSEAEPKPAPAKSPARAKAKAKAKSAGASKAKPKAKSKAKAAGKSAKGTT